MLLHLVLQNPLVLLPHLQSRHLLLLHQHLRCRSPSLVLQRLNLLVPNELVLLGKRDFVKVLVVNDCLPVESLPLGLHVSLLVSKKRIFIQMNRSNTIAAQTTPLHLYRRQCRHASMVQRSSRRRRLPQDSIRSGRHRLRAHATEILLWSRHMLGIQLHAIMLDYLIALGVLRLETSADQVFRPPELRHGRQFAAVVVDKALGV